MLNKLIERWWLWPHEYRKVALTKNLSEEGKIRISKTGKVSRDPVELISCERVQEQLRAISEFKELQFKKVNKTCRIFKKTLI